GHMVAKLPDREAFIPVLIFRFRAYQKVEEPESAVKIHPSGSKGDNSRNTRCGFMGLADCIALSSTVCHQSVTCFSTSILQLLTFLYWSIGIKACKVSLLSPSKF